MAVETLNYGGINRAVSDYGNPGSCEELINLRPTTEGLVPVKDFVPKFSNVNFRRVFVHHTTSGDKYIAVRREETDAIVSLVGDDGTVIRNLYNTPYDGASTIDGMHFATAGNVLFMSLCDKEYDVYDNMAWTWKDGDYAVTEAYVPNVTYSISDGSSIVSATHSIPALDVDSTGNDAVTAVENALNAIQENNPRLCVGPVLIATAMKTKDGNTFWTGNWKVYDPAKKIGTTSPPYMTSGSLNQTYTAPQYSEFLSAHGGYAYVVNDGYSDSSGWLGLVGLRIEEIRVYGTNVTLNFQQVATWNEDTSIIQSVEVYCSKPVPYLDASSAADGFKHFPWNQEYGFNVMLARKAYEDMDLGGQLMYHQASIQLSALSESAQSVELSFGGNVQVTDETLRVDSGHLRRYGKVLSYNARFHFYDSVAKVGVGMPSFLYHSSGTAKNAHVFVRYADSEHSELVYAGAISDHLGPADVVVAPSLNIKETVVYAAGSSASQRVVYTYRMQGSSSYNCSVCVGGPDDTKTVTGTVAELESLIRGGVKGVITEEPAAVNVSEQYDPFVFRVDHSYLAPGTILDVVPQLYVVTDATYGREPLDVFTDRGVYALVQGNGEVLYSSFEPITGKVAKRGAVPTETGIFFIADGALWLCAGRRATLVSDALHLGPHKYLRACTGYKEIAGTDADYSPDPAPANPAYDVSAFLSKVPFKTYAEGARLSFNRFRMEIFVSNPSYSYTYVLSLKYRQWFKISRTVWQDEPSSAIAVTPGGTAGRITILDLANEVEGGTALVHMQSRPFSFGYRYSHVHRMVAMTRANLSATGLLVAALYGSDDLQTWKLLAHSAKEGVKVSQMRTAPSARSWRYYVVCTGGDAPLDTDFGPFLVDVAPVVRRMG